MNANAGDTRVQNPNVYDSNDWAFSEQFQQAIDLLDQALRLEPPKLGQEIDIAERAIARLRDHLIHQLRQDNTSPESQRLRAARDHVNVALSLIVGVEYPAGGIQRKYLEQARNTLRDVLDTGMFVAASGSKGRSALQDQTEGNRTMVSSDSPSSPGHELIPTGLKIGMDVISSDNNAIGTIKEIREHDFLVNRPLQRDIYVPLTAIQKTQADRVILNVAINNLGDQDWSGTELFGNGPTVFI